MKKIIAITLITILLIAGLIGSNYLINKIFNPLIEKKNTIEGNINYDKKMPFEGVWMGNIDDGMYDTLEIDKDSIKPYGYSGGERIAYPEERYRIDGQFEDGSVILKYLGRVDAGQAKISMYSNDKNKIIWKENNKKEVILTRKEE